MADLVLLDAQAGVVTASARRAGSGTLRLRGQPRVRARPHPRGPPATAEAGAPVAHAAFRAGKTGSDAAKWDKSASQFACSISPWIPRICAWSLFQAKDDRDFYRVDSNRAVAVLNKISKIRPAFDSRTKYWIGDYFFAQGLIYMHHIYLRMDRSFCLLFQTIYRICIFHC